MHVGVVQRRKGANFAWGVKVPPEGGRYALFVPPPLWDGVKPRELGCPRVKASISTYLFVLFRIRFSTGETGPEAPRCLARSKGIGGDPFIWSFVWRFWDGFVWGFQFFIWGG